VRQGKGVGAKTKDTRTAKRCSQGMAWYVASSFARPLRPSHLTNFSHIALFFLMVSLPREASTYADVSPVSTAAKACTLASNRDIALLEGALNVVMGSLQCLVACAARWEGV